MDRVVCYVSGPLSSAPMPNLRRAIDIAEDLLTMGIVPVVPHLTILWNDVSEHDWDYWLDLDEGIIPKCDILLRFCGESKGADREVAFAQKRGIPVFHSVHAIETWMKFRQQPKSVLLEAEALVNGDRGANYGHPSEDFERAAGLMSHILGHEVRPDQVPLLQICIKLSRQVHKAKRDNLVDIAGYAETCNMLGETNE